MALLERAAEIAPDAASVQSAYGRALVRRAERNPSDEAALYGRAVSVLTRALELDRASVPTAVTLAAVLLSRGTDAARAVDLMRRVVQSMPGRENYRLLLARALAAHGDYAAAIDLLGPLVARASRPEMREAARELLGQVAAAAQPSVSGRP
jgi:cytochrome c-type biogenesis protein CcmH/NrfG